ncbi:MAG: carbohydrate kinase family protein [Deltaproteobacteria bacterium]|nr:carbohydrate kinase family protein [Deltaproteobacteria bacterium]
MNAREAARFLGEAEPSPNGDPEHAAALAERLYAQEKRPVFVTCGKMGMAVRDGTVAAFVPGVIAPEPVDEVGAGDTAVAALAAATRAGYAPVEAAGFANLAAAVTVSKVGQTGTASREEITALAEQARYRSIP